MLFLIVVNFYTLNKFVYNGWSKMFVRVSDSVLGIVTYLVNNPLWDMYLYPIPIRCIRVGNFTLLSSQNAPIAYFVY